MFIKKSIASGMMGSVRASTFQESGDMSPKTTLRRRNVQQSMLQYLDLPPLFLTW